MKENTHAPAGRGSEPGIAAQVAVVLALGAGAYLFTLAIFSL